MKILAIESSCDETAVAIIEDGNKILSNVVATQIDVHKEFGGVVPEVASRIHIENISIVLEKALEEAHVAMEDVDAIAVTQGPGLMGCLHVGIQAAKTLAWAYQKPLIPIHHISGHIYANNFVTTLQYPLLALVVSGGHTELVYMKGEWEFEILGMTQDDAIGEAYDKVARVLNLPYPGGPQIDRLAKEGKPLYELPKPKTEGEYDFSFSGLKSGVLQFIDHCHKKQKTYTAADLACSFQEAALYQIVTNVCHALDVYKPKQLLVAGGVAANSRLRFLVLEDIAKKYEHVECVVPPLAYCTDNAAMIGAAGYVAYRHGQKADFSLTACPGIDL